MTALPNAAADSHVWKNKNQKSKRNQRRKENIYGKPIKKKFRFSSPAFPETRVVFLVLMQKENNNYNNDLVFKN